MDEGGAHAELPWARRIRGEWQMLHALAALNPGRLTDLRQDDAVFSLTLREAPALNVNGEVSRDHGVRIEFPGHFPAAPLELYLETPMLHPNIHPETGFVCLWNRPRATDNVELALHKTVAILGLRLHNPDPLHVMQPKSLALVGPYWKDRVQAELACEPLLGIAHPALEPPATDLPRRRRLS